jgi:hypothetical protein
VGVPKNVLKNFRIIGLIEPFVSCKWLEEATWLVSEVFKPEPNPWTLEIEGFFSFFFFK